MKRIIIHWTGGTNQPNSTDLKHYHYLINGDGLIIEGKYKPEDNLNCNDDYYAAHTGGGNTGSIDIALCGMYGFKDKNNVGNYPLTAVQCEAMFKKCAELCKKYNIPITSDTVLTHYEFGRKYWKTSSNGKIDIIYLPPYKNIKQNEIGDFIRNKIKWYLNKIDL